MANTAEALVNPVMQPFAAPLEAASGLHSSPKNDYWDEVQHGLLRRLTYGRGIGTAVYAKVENLSRQSFQTDAQGAYVHHGRWHQMTRGTAVAFDALYDLMFGKGRKDYELTGKGFKELGLFKAIFSSVTPEALDAGYFRPRRYSLRKPDVAKLDRIAEIGDILRKADPELSEEERSKLAKEREDLEHSLASNKKSWGVQATLLGMGFALMGLTDFMSDTLFRRATKAVKATDQLGDPSWWKNGGWEKTKHVLSPGNLFGIGSLIRGAGGLLKEWGVDFIRGDGLYDLGQLIYPSVKEHYHRKQEGDLREIGIKDGKVEITKYGSGKKDLATLFNIPFTVYNWWGKFVWQDLLIDPWLKPKQSKLRHYMREHKVEGVGFFKNIWNTLVNFTAFSYIRTAQIIAFMWPAVTLGFSAERYYSNAAADEIKLMRRDAVLTAEIEAALKVANMSDAPSVNEIKAEVLKRINGRGESERAYTPREGVFTVSQGLSATYTKADKPQLIADILSNRTNDPSSIKEAIKAACEKAEHQFYVNYLRGERPDFHFAGERNGERSQDDSAAPDRLPEDAMGDALKNYVNLHSKMLQGGFRVWRERIKGKSLEEMTTAELKNLVNECDYGAAAMGGYAPYFGLKDAGMYIAENNKAINTAIDVMPRFLQKLRFPPKHDPLATRSGTVNGSGPAAPRGFSPAASPMAGGALRHANMGTVYGQTYGAHSLAGGLPQIAGANLHAPSSTIH